MCVCVCVCVQDLLGKKVKHYVVFEDLLAQSVAKKGTTALASENGGWFDLSSISFHCMSFPRRELVSSSMLKSQTGERIICSWTFLRLARRFRDQMMSQIFRELFRKLHRHGLLTSGTQLSSHPDEMRSEKVDKTVAG